MSGQFYTVLFFSLLLTVGIVLLFYVYRMILRMMRDAKNRIEYSVLYGIDNEPAHGNVIIRYDLPYETEVELLVKDKNEKTVSVLVKQVQQKGSHQAVFDSLAVENGICYYSLTTKNQSITKQMLIENS